MTNKNLSKTTSGSFTSPQKSEPTDQTEVNLDSDTLQIQKNLSEIEKELIIHLARLTVERLRNV